MTDDEKVVMTQEAFEQVLMRLAEWLELQAYDEEDINDCFYYMAHGESKSPSDEDEEEIYYEEDEYEDEREEYISTMRLIRDMLTIGKNEEVIEILNQVIGE